MIQVVKKPWGQEEIWAKTNRYVGKILTINPGHRLSLQYHKEKEEMQQKVYRKQDKSKRSVSQSKRLQQIKDR